MDQVTIQTILEGLILIILIFIGGVLVKILRVVTKTGNDVDAIARDTVKNGSGPPIGPK